jgi:hypothetical protein
MDRLAFSGKRLRKRMIYFYVILLLIILAFAWIYFCGVRIRALINIDQDTCIHILWNYPFLKATFALAGTIPVIKIFIFNLRIFKFRVKKKKRTINFMRVVQSIHASHIRIKTIYCLDNPFLTGIMCGVFNALLSFLDIEEITHVPDFSPGKDYIQIEGEAFINVRHSI